MDRIVVIGSNGIVKTSDCKWIFRGENGGEIGSGLWPGLAFWGKYLAALAVYFAFGAALAIMAGIGWG